MTNAATAGESSLVCSADDAVRTRVAEAIATLPAADRIPVPDGARAFDQPWQLRAISLAIALSDAGHFRWETFQTALVSSIHEWERDQGDDEWHYYDHVAAALETVLGSQGWADKAAIDARTADVLATPVDKDHQHAKHGPVAVDGGG